jgi:hypothetical protein
MYAGAVRSAYPWVAREERFRRREAEFRGEPVAGSDSAGRRREVPSEPTLDCERVLEDHT